jgi:hypothetical protein
MEVPDDWDLIPCLTIQDPPTSLRRSTAPLLVKILHALLNAVITCLSYPVWITVAMVRATLSASNEPVDALKVQSVDWAKKWLGTDETHGSRYSPQNVCAPRVLIGLHRDASPDMTRPWKVLGHAGEALWTLRQHLKNMPVSSNHRIEDIYYEVIGHVCVEEVRHGVYENTPGLLPPKGKLKSLMP